MSIQKRGEDVDWVLMKPLIFAAIMDHLQNGRPIIVENNLDNLNVGPSDTGFLFNFIFFK